MHLDHDQKISASAGAAYTLYDVKYGVDIINGSGLRDGTDNTRHLADYTQVHASARHTFDLGTAGPVEVRSPLSIYSTGNMKSASGSGIGVFAPQYGPRRGYFLVTLAARRVKVVILSAAKDLMPRAKDPASTTRYRATLRMTSNVNNHPQRRPGFQNAARSRDSRAAALLDFGDAERMQFYAAPFLGIAEAFQRIFHIAQHGWKFARDIVEPMRALPRL